ncbi:MAG: trehalose-phosphatase [Oligoflexia bacterium]|nr:trehalose-phosphatase [Oligoflexia bacterium]
MKQHLFSEAGLEVLADFLGGNPLFCFDYDGTLAPIVPDPARSRLSEEVRALLDRLSQRCTVGVISGRSLPDLKDRLGVPLPYLVGNHGLEGLPGSTPIARIRRLCAEWKRLLAPALRLLEAQGVWLEDKGWSLSVHYRNAPDPAKAENEVFTLVSAVGKSCRIIPGKLVFNLVPENSAHKGVALTRLMAHAKAERALFVGDDHTDEDVFAMRDPRVLGIHVGKSRQSAARFFLQEQEEVPRLLERILELRAGK